MNDRLKWRNIDKNDIECRNGNLNDNLNDMNDNDMKINDNIKWQLTRNMKWQITQLNDKHTMTTMDAFYVI